MNAKISVLIIFVEAIIYLLLYNLHDCTFKIGLKEQKTQELAPFGKFVTEVPIFAQQIFFSAESGIHTVAPVFVRNSF